MGTALAETLFEEISAPGRHLAIFIRSLEGGGGAERMMVSLARGFAERGHRVDLVLGVARGGFLEEVPGSVRIVELGRGSILRAVPGYLRDPANARKLAPAFRNVIPHWVLGCVPKLVGYLGRERPDAMLSALNYSNIAALWAKRLSDVPTRLIVSERNTVSRRAQVRRRNRSLPSLAAHFYPWADGISAVSDGVADDLARCAGIPRERIATTYNPVVSPRIFEQAMEPLDDPWFLEDGIPVILAAGKLKAQKGFDTLIDAFSILRRRRKARLVILGEGELRRMLVRRARRQGVENDVSFPGFVENPFRYMASASAFVLSSRWEGLPAVLIQAMACGCPVVSTDCPSGPREILDGGRYGKLVPVDDAAAMTRAIAATLEATRDPWGLERRARKYSIDRSVERYLDLMLG